MFLVNMSMYTSRHLYYTCKNPELKKFRLELRVGRTEKLINWSVSERFDSTAPSVEKEMTYKKCRQSSAMIQVCIEYRV